MEIKKFDINGKHVEFVNESGSTRHGFKHMTTMFVNDTPCGNNTTYYLNRTWERYPYQTCMRGCVSELIENRIENLKEKFKFENDYKVLTAKRKEEFEKYITDDTKLKFYDELREAIGW